MTERMAQEIYGELQDYDRLKLINQSLEKSINDYKENETVYLKEITELKDVNTGLEKSLSEVHSSSTWNDIGFFLLGVLTTGLTVYATKGH